MQTLTFETQEEWMEARRGKITGSRLKDIVVKRGTGKKVGFYELIAERIGLASDDEDPMERGHRLEEEAVHRFEKETGKKCDTALVMWVREDEESIAISPDASVVGENAAVEIKCLGAARHIEAWHTKSIPSDYEYQKLQYFIVNEELETLYFGFYNPLVPSIEFFWIEVKREDVQKEVDEYLAYQVREIEEVNAIVTELTF